MPQVTEPVSVELAAWKERPVSSGTLGFLEAVILSYPLTDEEIVSSSGQDQLIAKNKTP